MTVLIWCIRIKMFRTVWLLRNLGLNGKFGLDDDKKCYRFCIRSPYLTAVTKHKGLCKDNFFLHKSQFFLDRTHPTHPPPNPILFYFWKPISDTARTLKSQWLLTTFNNVQTEYITLRSYHMITQSPHWK